MSKSGSQARPTTFYEEVVTATPGGDPHLKLCLQCGTCGGSCPSGPDMDHTPRAIFAMIMAGMKEEVLKSNTPWYCVSCYYCMVRCPQKVHVTDLMYTLKRMAIQAGMYRHSAVAKAQGFSTTFIDFVENHGRSFELGLATRYHLTHHPLDMMKKAGLGLRLFRKGRLNLTPKSIKAVDSLKAILNRAKELGGPV